MPELIVITDSSEIREGKLDDLKAAMKDLVEFVEANESGIFAYNVYLSEDGRQVTVLQIHPDSASAEFHMKVAGPAFAKFADYIKMKGIDIYSRPSQDLLEKLQLKARILGSGTID